MSCNQSLLPCPFCGGKAVIEDHCDNGWYVGCTNTDGCDFTPSAWYDPGCFAVDQWNRRLRPILLTQHPALTPNPI